MADEAQRELSFGEKAVGLSFNPSGNQAVGELKEAAAAFIDLCNNMRVATNDPEVKRMAAVAITEAQTAQMWGVKAATWVSSPPPAPGQAALQNGDSAAQQPAGSGSAGSPSGA